MTKASPQPSYRHMEVSRVFPDDPVQRSIPVSVTPSGSHRLSIGQSLADSRWVFGKWRALNHPITGKFPTGPGCPSCSSCEHSCAGCVSPLQPRDDKCENEIIIPPHRKHYLVFGIHDQSVCGGHVSCLSQCIEATMHMNTECRQCRHTFLRYASACPECGCVRLKQRKVNKPMIASLIGSAVAIGMTVTMVVRYKHLYGDPHTDVQINVISTR